MKTKSVSLASEIQAHSAIHADSGMPPSEPLVARVVVLVSRKSYEEAANLLRTAPRSAWVNNTMGVCLMRSGRVDEALQIYRGLALIPGTTVLRPEADDYCRLNFATALLLKGLPSGAMDVLAELRDGRLAPAERLRQAVDDWARSLSFLRRLDWKFNRIDPPHCRVPIDFEPGEFRFETRPRQDDTPSRPTEPRIAA